MIKFHLKQNIVSKVKVPSCKYIANRVTMLAALADGESCLEGLPHNNDIKASLESLKRLGIEVSQSESACTLQGMNGQFKPINTTLDVHDSGTLLRFITAIASLCNQSLSITGSQRIAQRPIKDLLQVLEQWGSLIGFLKKDGYVPFEIVGQKPKGGHINIEATKSSQFVSALCLIAPFAKNDTTIHLQGDVVSRSYIELTMMLMRLFGADIKWLSEKEIWVAAGKTYKAQTYTVPADWSSASYFLAIPALVPNSSIEVLNTNTDSVQGERKFAELLSQMGCDVSYTSHSIVVKSPQALKGLGKIEMGDMPDVVQTLAVIAPFADSSTTITDIAHLKYKESDRIEDTATELRKANVKIETTSNSMSIHPSSVKPTCFDTHNDHRMAMSLSLMGLRVAGMSMQNQEVVAKSFPGFWEQLKALGVEIEHV